MFSVILSWGREGGTSTGRRSKRQGKKGECHRGQAGGPVESGYPPCHPQRKRWRTQTTKTAVARPRGNAISIPGWSWGRLEPPAPWGQRTRGSSGQGAGLESAAQTPRPRGRGYGESTGRSLRTKVCTGGQGRDRLKSSWGQAGLEDEPGPQRLAVQPLTQRLPGNAAGPALPAQSRYRRGLGVPVWAGEPALTPSPTRSLQGSRPSPPLTALLHHRAGLQPLPRHPWVLMPSPGTLFGPGRCAAQAGTALAARDWASGVCDSLPGAPLATPLLLR